jgi:hypothetical protein
VLLDQLEHLLDLPVVHRGVADEQTHIMVRRHETGVRGGRGGCRTC